jgi:hypothetical protein
MSELENRNRYTVGGFIQLKIDEVPWGEPTPFSIETVVRDDLGKVTYPQVVKLGPVDRCGEAVMEYSVGNRSAFMKSDPFHVEPGQFVYWPQ